MIADIQRDLFLANPTAFASCPCLAVAAVARDNLNEPELLEGWSSLKEHLNGSGTRSGYRAFLALLRDDEAELRIALTKFTDQNHSHASWHFVAAPINKPEGALEVIQQVEWRAHKDAQSPGESPLTLVGSVNAL
jgi:hypothetical protein